MGLFDASVGSDGDDGQQVKLNGGVAAIFNMAFAGLFGVLDSQTRE